MKAYVDGKLTKGEVKTVYAKRFNWLPSFLMRWAFFRIQYKVYRFKEAPPGGSNVTIVYESDVQL